MYMSFKKSVCWSFLLKGISSEDFAQSEVLVEEIAEQTEMELQQISRTRQYLPRIYESSAQG